MSREFIIKEHPLFPYDEEDKPQELIRCRECICWRADKWFCTMWKVGTPDDGFCYMGNLSDIPTGSERSSDA